jgi:hypothetical protein
VYGGESLHHPDIVEILNSIRTKYKSYSDRWHLTVTTTTNAIVSDKKLKQIIPYIDEFTVSYHPENTKKQHQQFKDNLLTIAAAGKRQKCVVLMAENTQSFDNSIEMIEWLNQHNIKLLPRQLDGSAGVIDHKRVYNQSQVTWFDNLYTAKSFGNLTELLKDKSELVLTDVGRACCGGRQVCSNQDYKNRNFYVGNKFPDWFCSVNWFFLYVKQVNGEVYVNKDCKMNFEGSVGPIGNLADTPKIINKLSEQFKTQTLPIIQCKKSNCFCGLCAPKAKTLDTYKKIINKYQQNYTSCDT